MKEAAGRGCCADVEHADKSGLARLVSHLNHSASVINIVALQQHLLNFDSRPHLGLCQHLQQMNHPCGMLPVTEAERAGLYHNCAGIKIVTTAFWREVRWLADLT